MIIRFNAAAACFALFAMLSAAGYPAQLKAQDTSNSEIYGISRVGVIELGRILREAEATVRVRALLDEKSSEFQKEFSERELQLQAKEKEIKAKQGLVSESAYQDEVRAFQAEVADIQREIQTRRRSLDRAFQQAQDKIRELAISIITERATELKLDLVLKDDQMIVFRNQLNFTDDVLSRLNERTRDATVELSEETQEQGK